MERLDCFLGGTVICELEETEKYEALHELIHKAPVFRSIGDMEALENAVVSRERQQSTGFGHGVAIAHGKLKGMGSIRVALGISRKGIEFGSMDGKPVHLLFVVASPPEMQLEYLLALSIITGLVRNPRFREELMGCGDPDAIENRLCAAFRENLHFRMQNLHKTSGLTC